MTIAFAAKQLFGSASRHNFFRGCAKSLTRAVLEECVVLESLFQWLRGYELSNATLIRRICSFRSRMGFDRVRYQFRIDQLGCVYLFLWNYTQPRAMEPEKSWKKPDFQVQ